MSNLFDSIGMAKPRMMVEDISPEELSRIRNVLDKYSELEKFYHLFGRCDTIIEDSELFYSENLLVDAEKYIRSIQNMVHEDQYGKYVNMNLSIDGTALRYAGNYLFKMLKRIQPILESRVNDACIFQNTLLGMSIMM